MVKVLRSYCITCVSVLCLTLFACGIVISAENTQTTAFGTEQTVVAVSRKESGLNIEVKNIVKLSFSPKISSEELNDFLCLLPFPAGNIFTFSDSVCEIAEIIKDT